MSHALRPTLVAAATFKMPVGTANAGATCFAGATFTFLSAMQSLATISRARVDAVPLLRALDGMDRLSKPQVAARMREVANVLHNMTDMQDDYSPSEKHVDAIEFMRCVLEYLRDVVPDTLASLSVVMYNSGDATPYLPTQPPYNAVQGRVVSLATLINAAAAAPDIHRLVFNDQLLLTVEDWVEYEQLPAGGVRTLLRKDVEEVHYNEAVQLGGRSYEPTAVLLHAGITSLRGHYTVLMRQNGQWWWYDDDQPRKPWYPSVLSTPPDSRVVAVLLTARTPHPTSAQDPAPSAPRSITSPAPSTPSVPDRSATAAGREAATAAATFRKSRAPATALHSETTTSGGQSAATTAAGETAAAAAAVADRTAPAASSAPTAAARGASTAAAVAGKNMSPRGKRYSSAAAGAAAAHEAASESAAPAARGESAAQGAAADESAAQAGAGESAAAAAAGERTRARSMSRPTTAPQQARPARTPRDAAAHEAVGESSTAATAGESAPGAVRDESMVLAARDESAAPVDDSITDEPAAALYASSVLGATTVADHAPTASSDQMPTRSSRSALIAPASGQGPQVHVCGRTSRVGQRGAIHR